MRFPPLLPRRDLETVGYLKSFPHLAGSIFAFDGSEAQAAEQYERASAPRGLERVPADDRPRAHAGRLLPGLPRDRRPRAAGRRRRHGRRRRRLRLPARALRRSGAPADVPPARDRAHRRARDGRRRGATPGASAPLELLGGLGLEVELDVATRPVLRPQRPDARRQPARAAAQVRGARRRSPAPSRRRSRRSTTTRTTSPPPTGSSSPTARRRTPPASASAWSGSRSRCSAPTASTRRRGRREVREQLWPAMSAATARAGQPARARPGDATARSRAARSRRGPTSRPTATPTS